LISYKAPTRHRRRMLENRARVGIGDVMLSVRMALFVLFELCY